MARTAGGVGQLPALALMAAMSASRWAASLSIIRFMAGVMLAMLPLVSTVWTGSTNRANAGDNGTASACTSPASFIAISASHAGADGPA
ncbi:hypothetical protein [Sandarakinorhabdus sp.]|uniref:hypothetical protein n=1 Tax=Sandarakinorhabdus sp. TaxID=1916663 RepID=UPI00286D816F|nr:hypothetical protein [Sandarakinorhabdus sp.]